MNIEYICQIEYQEASLCDTCTHSVFGCDKEKGCWVCKFETTWDEKERNKLDEFGRVELDGEGNPIIENYRELATDTVKVSTLLPYREMIDNTDPWLELEAYLNVRGVYDFMANRF